MKPWEETWAVIGSFADGGQVFGPWCVVDGRSHVVATFGDGCSNDDSARLAACAPEMARLLLEVEGAGERDGDRVGAACPFCGGFGLINQLGPGVEPICHEGHCALVAVLKKAGVR